MPLRYPVHQAMPTYQRSAVSPLPPDTLPWIQGDGIHSTFPFSRMLLSTVLQPVLHGKPRDGIWFWPGECWKPSNAPPGIPARFQVPACRSPMPHSVLHSRTHAAPFPTPMKYFAASRFIYAIVNEASIPQKYGRQLSLAPIFPTKERKSVRNRNERKSVRRAGPGSSPH